MCNDNNNDNNHTNCNNRGNDTCNAIVWGFSASVSAEPTRPQVQTLSFGCSDPESCHNSYVCVLYYHSNNLSFKHSLAFHDFPIPISSVFLCFK